MRLKYKNDSGVAGLTVLLSLVTLLFVIGLLVMIFSLMGGELQDATYTSTTVTATNETVTGLINQTGTSSVTYSQPTYRNAVVTVSVVHNASNGYIIPTANYTVNTSTGSLTNTTVADYPWPVNVSYSTVYDADNDATDVMNDTVAGISGVTDWYNIFIVIGALVVLILLTVIIITAIRGSGLMAGGSA